MIREDKSKALNTALQEIEKQFGKGAVMKLGEAGSMIIDSIPTGSTGLDIAVGIGGLPKGRVVEVYGPESSGKTTVALHSVAEVQKIGGIAAYIDAEHALDSNYARALGVDIDNLIISQPDTGEQGLEITEALIRSGAIDLIVIDSVAALVPKAEIDGDMGDTHVGRQARLMSQALRKLTGLIKKSNCTAIFINQLREKVGITFGSPETTSGGRALKFFSSVRLDVRRIDSIKQGDRVIGNRVRVRVVKNKVAPPFKKAEFDIIYGEGISSTGEIVDIGSETDIIKKSGSWYSYNDNKLGQGRENVKKFLTENKDILKEIELKIREYHDLTINKENPTSNITNSTSKETQSNEVIKVKKEKSSKDKRNNKLPELNPKKDAIKASKDSGDEELQIISNIDTKKEGTIANIDTKTNHHTKNNKPKTHKKSQEKVHEIAKPKTEKNEIKSVEKAKEISSCISTSPELVIEDTKESNLNETNNKVIENIPFIQESFIREDDELAQALAML